MQETLLAGGRDRVDLVHPGDISPDAVQPHRAHRLNADVLLGTNNNNKGHSG